MKLTLENTAFITEVNGVPARIWLGTTDKGIEVHALITRVAVHNSQDQADFERELQEQPAPVSADATVWPLRMIL